MKKKIIITIAAIVVILNMLPLTMQLPVNDYRNPLQLVTWTYGVALNDDGAGRLELPFVDGYYNYIGYDPETTHAGDHVFSVFVYNPLTLWNDDIIFRYDFL